MTEKGFLRLFTSPIKVNGQAFAHKVRGRVTLFSFSVRIRRPLPATATASTAAASLPAAAAASASTAAALPAAAFSSRLTFALGSRRQGRR